MKHATRSLLALTVFAVALPSPAMATVVRSGMTNTPLNGFGPPDAAYDSINLAYLVVAAGQFGVVGRLLDLAGIPVGDFSLNIRFSTSAASSARVAFSPDANGGRGAFLVTWQQSDLGGVTSVHGHMASTRGEHLFGAESVLSTEGSWWGNSAAIAYSTRLHEFLVTYALAPSGDGVRAIRVDNNAVALAAPFTIKRAGQYAHYPSIAYDSATDQFLVVYSGYDPVAAVGYAESVLVQAGSNQLASGAVRLATNAGTWITAVTYNSRKNQFFAAWFTLSPTRETQGRLIAADGSLTGNAVVVSTRWTGTDSLGLAYNAISNSMFLVSNDSLSGETGGVELDGDGNPVDAGVLVSTTGSLTESPHIAASSDAPAWLVCFANNYRVTMTQLIVERGAPNFTQLQMYVDTPSNNAIVSTKGFVVAGWAADIGVPTGTGTGVSGIDVEALPSNGGSLIFVGAATYGGARPDVGAYLGGQFTNTGFGLIAVLPPGTYTLLVSAGSSVNPTEGPLVTPVKVTVQAPPSNPLMWVDAPAPNQTIGQSVFVGGWAVDLTATIGPGVDTVHVWAYPQGSLTPVFVGAGTTGGARPDVGAWLGSQFAGAGYNVTGTLSPGNYTLVVFAHSTVTGTFNDAKTVSVTVR